MSTEPDPALVRVLLMLVPDAAPIEGTLTRLDGGDVRPFYGWMGLTARLEELRGAAGNPTDSPLAHRPDTVKAAEDHSPDP